MEHLIEKTVIFKTKRKPMRSNALIPLFPEHTFSGKIVSVIGDFISIKDIRLLMSEGKYNGEYGQKHTLLARDKLSDTSSYNSISNICLIKIKKNLYFDIYMYTRNIDLLNSIINNNWFPKLYNICYYNLSTMEIKFAREILNTY